MGDKERLKNRIVGAVRTAAEDAVIMCGDIYDRIELQPNRVVITLWDARFDGPGAARHRYNTIFGQTGSGIYEYETLDSNYGPVDKWMYDGELWRVDMNIEDIRQIIEDTLREDDNCVYA